MRADDLKIMRKAMGMSQAELGEAIGMSREAIGQMERGVAPIERRTGLAVTHVTQSHTRYRLETLAAASESNRLTEAQRLSMASILYAIARADV